MSILAHLGSFLFFLIFDNQTTFLFALFVHSFINGNFFPNKKRIIKFDPYRLLFGFIFQSET